MERPPSRRRFVYFEGCHPQRGTRAWCVDVANPFSFLTTMCSSPMPVANPVLTRTTQSGPCCVFIGKTRMWVRLQFIATPLTEFDHSEKGDALYAMEFGSCSRKDGEQEAAQPAHCGSTTANLKGFDCPSSEHKHDKVQQLTWLIVLEIATGALLLVFVITGVVTAYRSCNLKPSIRISSWSRSKSWSAEITVLIGQ
ncbi:uncharacterized protein LOC119330878 [Triticum dicoccoides]|uniref:uncharacterized protein LOC119330878 n=1 Tax=Triticum dicoccoides TaxID=85692 RepID=UPI00188E912B|nr:uncharacterized protein LOC119330878 [Triticum dicoccoides]XP_037459912.1 uncharacterized protein LOC119330878 [Triticum dicoccoides]XP_044394295.1 uncharacterized protein LOC123117635 isoform X2 [Triticum aestivum]